MTQKLYDIDSNMSTFTAKVLSCEADKGHFAVILDRTAFFPEGGGQYADIGKLGNAKVLDVQISGDNIITHYTDIPLEVGCEVSGKIDWELRHRRMQNHSGEHIVSGTIHRLFGFDNVGFHLGDGDMTIDINGELTCDDLDRIELIANRAVAENVEIRAEYPDKQTLAGMEYRSKLELAENIRIVTIDGYDCCACCAPHVSRTGEIGIIKLLDFMRYKGGVRIHMLCGIDALDDYKSRYASVSKISAMLSAKQSEIAQAVERVQNELGSQRQTISELKNVICDMMQSQLRPTEGNLCAFGRMLDIDSLRRVVNNSLSMCGGMCAAFSGSDDDGYMYVIGSESIPLRAAAKDINKALCGKGGGRDEMIQGSVTASRAEIEAFFADYRG